MWQSTASKTCANMNLSTKTVTRTSFQLPIFGCVSDLKFTQLPTYEGVIKAVLFRKKHLKLQTNKDPSVTEICKNLAVNISSIYNEASIPAVSVKQISGLIFCNHTKYQGLMKSYKAHCNEENYSEKINSFLDKSKKLFDFSSCKCADIYLCSCPKDKKVPGIERTFLLDQRNERQMFIGPVDIATSNKLSKRANRRESLHSPGVSRVNEKQSFLMNIVIRITAQMQRPQKLKKLNIFLLKRP